MKFNLEKFKSLVTSMSDEERRKMEFRKENRHWLKMSAGISLKILKLLNELNMSREEFADKMGTDVQQVNEWLSGKTNFDIKTLTKIQRVLDRQIIKIV